MKNKTGQDLLNEYERTYYCGVCFTKHLLDDPSDVLGFICPVCYWEWDGRDIATKDGDPRGVSETFGPNRVSMTQARKNYLLYRACDPHGYRCKTGHELPRGVDGAGRRERPDTYVVWMIMTRCPECGEFTDIGYSEKTGYYGNPCPVCPED